MSRLTITLRDDRYQALKETAARQRKTIGQIVDESLEFYGVKTYARAMQLLKRARARATLTEEQAMELAVRETRAERRLRAARAK